MVIRRVASAAARTAINTTGTKLRACAVQGGDKYGAPRTGNRAGALADGEIHLRNWKTYELQVRDPICVLRFFPVRDNTAEQTSAWAFASKANEWRCRNVCKRQEGRVHPAHQRGSRGRPG